MVGWWVWIEYVVVVICSLVDDGVWVECGVGIIFTLFFYCSCCRTFSYIIEVGDDGVIGKKNENVQKGGSCYNWG